MKNGSRWFRIAEKLTQRLPETLIEALDPMKSFKLNTGREKRFFSFRSIGSKNGRVSTRAGLPDRSGLAKVLILIQVLCNQASCAKPKNNHRARSSHSCLRSPRTRLFFYDKSFFCYKAVCPRTPLAAFRLLVSMRNFAEEDFEKYLYYFSLWHGWPRNFVAVTNSSLASLRRVIQNKH